MTLKLETTAEIDDFAFNLTSMQMKFERWMQQKIRDIVEEEVMIPIWESMRAHEFSQKIIDGTEIEVIIRKGSKLTIRVVSRLMTDDGDYDIAKGREEGTVDHWVEPLTYPTAYRTQSGTTSKRKTKEMDTASGKKALHWTTKFGEQAFSKGHVTGGIEQKYIVKRAVEVGTPKVKERLKEEFKLWRDDILNI